MICMYGPSKDLEVEAVGGYYLALDSAERIGPAELREGKIWSPEKTQVALLIKGAEWADEVRLHTNRGTHTLKVQKHDSCPSPTPRKTYKQKIINNTAERGRPAW